VPLALEQFIMLGSNNTIKGLAINNTVSGGATPNSDLISELTGVPSTNTTIQAVRLDGGAGSLSCSGCTPVRNLVAITETGVVISNVEARSAYGYGAQFPSSGSTPVASIADSWFHNNFNDNLYVTDASMSRNLIELAGLRASDNTLV